MKFYSMKFERGIEELKNKLDSLRYDKSVFINSRMTFLINIIKLSGGELPNLNCKIKSFNGFIHIECLTKLTYNFEKG
jgi:hypothetical protein